MLWRLKELFDGGGELIRAEAELAMNRLKRGLLAAVLLDRLRGGDAFE